MDIQALLNQGGKNPILGEGWEWCLLKKKNLPVGTNVKQRNILGSGFREFLYHI